MKWSIGGQVRRRVVYFSLNKFRSLCVTLWDNVLPSTAFEFAFAHCQSCPLPTHIPLSVHSQLLCQLIKYLSIKSYSSIPHILRDTVSLLVRFPKFSHHWHRLFIQPLNVNQALDRESTFFKRPKFGEIGTNSSTNFPSKTWFCPICTKDAQKHFSMFQTFKIKGNFVVVDIYRCMKTRNT